MFALGDATNGRVHDEACQQVLLQPVANLGVIGDFRAVHVGGSFPSIDLTRKNSAKLNLGHFWAEVLLRYPGLKNVISYMTAFDVSTTCSILP
jgi:hypothetical protein